MSGSVRREIQRRLTEQNAGFTYLRGTCGGGTPFEGGIAFTRRCEDVLVQSHFSSANITVRGWTFILRGSPREGGDVGSGEA